MTLFRSGQPIKNRLIPGAVLLNALLEKVPSDGEQQSSPLTIVDSIIDGSIDAPSNGALEVPIALSITGSIFRGPLTLRGTFDGPLNFSDSTFHHAVDFAQSRFGAGVNFQRATFTKAAQFWGSTFHQRASFEAARFLGWANFDGAILHSDANFQAVLFGGDAEFIRTQLRNIEFGKASFARRADFRDATIHDATFADATFKDAVAFNHATIFGRMGFLSNLFEGNVFFDELNRDFADPLSLQGSITFLNVTFSGRVYFRDAAIQTLRLSTEHEDGPGTYSPIVFAQRVAFTRLQCRDADFTNAEFRSQADFSGAKFYRSVNLSRAVFEGEADFGQTAFPALEGSVVHSNAMEQDLLRRGLRFDGVRFEKTLNVNWQQIMHWAQAGSPGTWAHLESVFKRSGNLTAQNEALYQRRLQSLTVAGGWQRLADEFEYRFWGFGVRPIRLLTWMLGAHLLFSLLYWTQTRMLGGGRGTWEDR